MATGVFVAMSGLESVVQNEIIASARTHCQSLSSFGSKAGLGRSLDSRHRAIA